MRSRKALKAGCIAKTWRWILAAVVVCAIGGAFAGYTWLRSYARMIENMLPGEGALPVRGYLDSVLPAGVKARVAPGPGYYVVEVFRLIDGERQDALVAGLSEQRDAASWAPLLVIFYSDCELLETRDDNGVVWGHREFGDRLRESWVR